MCEGQISKDLELNIQNAEYLSEASWDYLMLCETVPEILSQ